MRRRHLIALVIVVVCLPLALVAAYDLVVWRWGYQQTGWCEKTAESSPEVWGPGSSVEDQIDFSGSSDYQCDPCSIAFTRSPRLVLDDVDQDRHVVEPCNR